MKTLGNLIWLLFGGVIIALEYILASIPLIVSIIGIPFGIQTLKLAGLALWPFGKEVRVIESRVGCLSTLMNLIWLLIGGIWIALSHLIFGLLFSITIIGIPFGMQHFKLAGLALSPFGREIGYN
ncbi:MAG: YccF domain-containing protein [Bacteroidales bacterium]|nr:YccF domain-containing protein [Bacteroidales bacterium]